MKPYDILRECTGFEWDDDNSFKNWHKHKVSPHECEEIFFNRPLALASDQEHSKKETRFHALGITNAGRGLFVAFAVRKGKMRVISARDMTKKESRVYKEHGKREKA
jgi:hypothetical protein